MGKSLYDDCIERDAFELLVQWDQQKNGTLTPRDVARGSHKKVWWKCGFGHAWQAEIKSRTQGTRCPVCSNKRLVPGVNDLGTTHPSIASQWHKEKNGQLTPQSVVHGNHRKVWWRCEKGHEWQASVLSRTSNGNGCPVCAGKVVVPGVNDLASQRPRVASQWHPTHNGDLTPWDVAPYSNRKVWWVCEKGHAYRAAIAHRSQFDSDCPYCMNRKVLTGFNDLATTEPKIASQWHPELNGGLNPQMVTAGSHKKVWWQCSEGHVWKAVIYSRTGSKKCGCPVCAGKVKQYLRSEPHNQSVV